MRQLLQRKSISKENFRDVWHLLLVLWGSVTYIALNLHPESKGFGTHQQLGLPACPSILVSNHPCPGCGLTTSICALLHGQLKLAFTANIFGVLFYCFLSLVLALKLFDYLFQKNTSGFFISIGAPFLWVSFFAFGLTRMILLSY